MNGERLLRLRRLSTVPRWAVIPTLRRQSVAEHSFQVCNLALWIAPWHRAYANGEIPPARLMMAAMYHDEFEAVTGDIAAPAKKWVSGLEIRNHEEKLGIGEFDTNDIKQILKVADLLEAYLFLLEEDTMGNSTTAYILRDVTENLQKAWDNFDGGNGKPSLDYIREALQNVVAPHMHPALSQVS